MRAGSPWIRRRRAKLLRNWRNRRRIVGEGTCRENAVSRSYPHFLHLHSSLLGCTPASNLLPSETLRLQIRVQIRQHGLRLVCHGTRNLVNLTAMRRRRNLNPNNNSLPNKVDRRTNPYPSNPSPSKRRRNWNTRLGRLRRGVRRRNRVGVRS